ncbi:MAG: hypothetical protein KJ847_02455 [Firmicutes bacterium]|nr:hypothetical protein [Bacillota bacterium]
MPKIEKFDFDKNPVKEKFFLTPIAYLLSFPEVWKRKLKIKKTNMEGVKPPYVLLCTHQAFLDFKVTTAAIFPRRANYIVAIDGFIGREWLVRNAGGIGKRKFTNDIRLIKQVKYSLEELKYIVAIYPEARYSLIGTNAILPESLGKMIKILKQPVVMLNMHGHYLSQPVWNLKQRKVNVASDMTQIITKDELSNLSVSEINERIHQAFIYDEYQWQLDNQIKITEPFRAEGLHKVLYQCPSCHAEFKMDSQGSEVFCTHCGKRYYMNEFGQLSATEGVTEFSHIPDWYEWQREQVKQEILSGQYHFEDEVRIESLPNAKGYIELGIGKLTHTEKGFILDGSNLEEPLLLEKSVLSLYGLHIEYNYLGTKGDCIDLSTLGDTYYLYPLHQQNVVTKLHFAVEELCKIEKSKVKSKTMK